jgi:hypothetical protein
VSHVYLFVSLAPILRDVLHVQIVFIPPQHARAIVPLAIFGRQQQMAVVLAIRHVPHAMEQLQVNVQHAKMCQEWFINCLVVNV